MASRGYVWFEALEESVGMDSRRSRKSRRPFIESLESRRLLSWGAVPQLVGEDVAAQAYGNIRGQGEVVVNIDSGVDFNHPSLAGKFWTNPGETPGNGIDDDRNGFIDDTNGWDFYRNNNNPIDEVGHGTQTIGIIAADPWTYAGDGNGYQGIAPDVRILPLKVSVPVNPSAEFDRHVGQALDYTLWLVKNHPEYNIVAVNLSLAAYSQGTFEQYEQKAVEELHDLGVFIAAAAGNYSSPTMITYPAADPKVFAIASVNPDGTLSPASNRGPKTALLAPGNQVPILEKGGIYLTSGDGTSYATAFVTGAAALIKQVNPKLSPDGIMSILRRSGVLTYDRPSHRTYARLDLAAAIALAQNELNTPLPFADTLRPIAGKIEIEHFDEGGEGVAFHDTDSPNNGSAFRNTGVAIEPCAEGGFDVTATQPGEWLGYTVNVAASGIYALQMRVASRRGGGTFHVEADGHDVTGPMTVPRTGSWQVFATVTRPGVRFYAGQHVLKLVMDANGSSGLVGNFNWMNWVITTARTRRRRGP